MSFGFFLGLICLASGLAQGAVSPSQLVGTWVRTSPADIQALEFTKDGKVQLYYGGGNDAMAADYSIAGDGRLTLGMGGLNTFYLPTMSGDQLQLKQPESGNVSSYRRLKSGETIPAAITAQEQSEKQLTAARNAAIPAFLVRQDLVMINSGGQGAPPTAIIQFGQGQNGYVGQLVYDTKPPKSEPLTAEIRSGDGDNPSVTVFFNPNGPNGGGGNFTFHSNGAAPNITLVSKVSFRGVFDDAPLTTVIIKPDAALHAQILGSIKTQVAQLEAQKQPIIAMLKDYAVIKGTSQAQFPTDKLGFTDEFVLGRNGQNNAWVGQLTLTNRTSGAREISPAMASVVIAGGKPAIQILTQKRLYQLTNIDPAGKKAGGVWVMQNNNMGHPVDLAITEAMAAPERDKLFAARKAALEHLAPDTVFHALLNDKYGNSGRSPSPIAVTLSVAPNGAVTGTADYPQQGCTMTLAGKATVTVLGPQLVVHYTGGKANPNAWRDVAAFMAGVQQETWTLGASGDAAGPMRLSGFAVVNPRQNPEMLGLELIQYTAQDRAALTQALGGGTHFKVFIPQMGGPDTIVEFTTDPKTEGNFQGHIISGGSHLGAPVGLTFSGPAIDHANWLELTMVIARPGSKPSYAYTIVATPTDAGIYLSGCQYNIQQTRVMAFTTWDAIQVKP